MNLLRITSVFENGNVIPEKYTCKGENISPPLLIENIPSEAKTLVLIMDDSDSAGGNSWVHWIVFDIPISENSESFDIKENSIPGIQGMNDFKQIDYGGPCPLSGVHRYHFRVFALNSKLGLDEGVIRDELERFMKEHIVAKGELIGKFSKT